MNEQNQEKLNELVTNLINFVEKSGEFVSKEVPLVIQEFLMYRFIEALILLVSWIVITILLGIMALVFIKKNKQAKKTYDALLDKEKDKSGLLGGRTVKYWDTPKPHQFTSIISSAAFSIVFIAFICHGINLITIMVKIKVAPRIYLIEELPKLIGF